VKDALGSVQSVAVFGGTSEIGLDIARGLVADRARTVVLAARDTAGAEQAAAPLRAAGAEVDVVALDLDRPDVRAVFDRPEGIDVAIVAAGILDGDPARLQAVNGAGAVAVMDACADAMRRQGRGTIVLLSSVAADRPRVSNYAYGASKAAADAYARGLRDALHGSGVDVMIVRPGFVRTRMTEGMDPTPGAVDPPAVTAAVVDGLRAGRGIVYVPGFLRWVMLVLKLVPRPVFRRLPL
jgi:decaprenylphospho-beta-D-erythro-pentofuranosid-2-ulose 2-reductase